MIRDQSAFLHKVANLSRARLSRRGLVQAGTVGVALAGLSGLPKGAFAQATPSASPAITPYNGEKVTISYGFWDSSQQKGVEAQIAAFSEKFPDITVDIQLVPWADYWTKLQTSVAGGEAFDVFWINSASLPVYAASDSLLPIDSLIEGGSIDPSQFPTPLVDMYSYNGVQYGIPRDFDTIGLFYNKDIFDAAGMDYPTAEWTWNDFRAAAEELTDSGAGQWGAGLQTSWQETYYNFIFQNEGELLNEDRTKSLIGEPAACEAIEYLTGFFTDELTPSIAIQQSNAVAETLFPAGQVAMMPGGSFRAATYAQADANIDVAPLPKGKVQATVIHGLGNVAWSGSKSPGAALELINFFSSEEAETILGESGIGLPAMNGMQGTWLESVPDMDLQVFVDAADYGVQVPDPEVGFEWQVAIQEVVVDGWSGNIPADEICTKAAEAADAALEGAGS